MNTKLPENSLILLEGGSLRGLYTAGALQDIDVALTAGEDATPPWRGCRPGH